MRYSAKELEKLALAQINLLQQRIGGGQWITLLNQALQEACYQGSTLEMKVEEIPILMVFPTSEPIYGPIVQMITVKVNGKSGQSYYGWKKIADEPLVPATPYFILGVNIGFEDTPTSGETALIKILGLQKSPLTCGENISLTTQYSQTLAGLPGWLGSAALGSKTKSDTGKVEECFPLIDMTDGYPIIKGKAFQKPLDRVNFPSCRRRVCAPEQTEFELGV